MPRSSRKKSSTSIYHVILRGINKQIIFEDDEDYKKYIYTLIDCKEKSGYKIFAYCLMSNHIHLLLKEEIEDLGVAFRRIGASYVYWYNLKYGRSGHLFQDRYKSENVETTKYFLAVLRYIHQNPVKSGIVKKADEYRWSSYNEYITGSYGNLNLCDRDYVLELFSEDLKHFEHFNNETFTEEFIDYYEPVKLNDEQASMVIKEISHLNILSEIQSLDKERRNIVLKKCKNSGLSIRQIERLTGVSFGVIRRL